jgi:hypothetical protein
MNINQFSWFKCIGTVVISSIYITQNVKSSSCGSSKWLLSISKRFISYLNERTFFNYYCLLLLLKTKKTA